MLRPSESANAQPQRPASALRASLRPASYYVPMGSPVWVTFTIENMGDEPITLAVPNTEPKIPSPEVGLPLAHIFSGGPDASISIATESGRLWSTPVGYRAPRTAPILIIGPYSSVGTTLDLRQYFPTLRGAGRFRILWKPYDGAVVSEPVVVTIARLKQAEILTDFGTMTVRFFYAATPIHVANFIELAQAGFYNGTTFHRIEPGYFIQAGCSRGDGTGIRTDGKRLAPEFNSRPMRKGTMAMALLDDDPDSASSQFFICNTRQKDWDGRYTAFAELVGEASFETLDQLMAIEVGDDGRPQRPLSIRLIRLIDAPADEIP